MMIKLIFLLLLGFFHASTGQSPSECGVPFLSRGLIYGGNEIVRGSFPWMVALMYKKNEESDSKYICGGVLISDKHVLTCKYILKLW